MRRYHEGWREKAIEALAGDGKGTRFTFVLDVDEANDEAKLKWIWEEGGGLGRGVSSIAPGLPSGPRKVGFAKMRRLRDDGGGDGGGAGSSEDAIRAVMVCAAELNAALQRDNADLRRDMATLRAECDRAHGRAPHPAPIGHDKL